MGTRAASEWSMVGRQKAEAVAFVTLKHLHSREGLSFCVFRAFFFAREDTIQNPNIHNNLIHCFMEKHSSSTELPENQIKNSGMALQPSSWRRQRCEHRAHTDSLAWSSGQLPLLQSCRGLTDGFDWDLFANTCPPLLAAVLGHSQISQGGAANTASHSEEMSSNGQCSLSAIPQQSTGCWEKQEHPCNANWLKSR